MILEGIFGAQLEYDEQQEKNLSRRGTVIIFPGGGYSWLSQREAWPVARAFNRGGYRAVILRYDVSSSVLKLNPVRQAAWATGKVRELFPGEPVFLMGFSAGGHCAASLGMHWKDRDWNGEDLFTEVRRYLLTHRGTSQEAAPQTDNAAAESGSASGSLGGKRTDRMDLLLDMGLFRPDRLILAYPVILGGKDCHEDSMERLLGRPADAAVNFSGPEEYERARAWMSLEQQVSASAMPCFVWQTQADEAVPVTNSLSLVTQLILHRIPVEYHIYPRGVHGLSLATEEVEEPEKGRMADLHVAGWFRELLQWLQEPVS